MEHSRSETNLTRRGFLKTTAAAAGSATLVGATSALTAIAEPSAAPDEEIFYGLCRGNCSGGCRLKIKKRGGHVVQTEMAPYPDERYNRICSKGLSHVQRMYSDGRVKYPMKRKDGTPRGGGEWEQISWDEAIDLIATTWKKLIAESGGTSLLFSAGTTAGLLQDAYGHIGNALGACSGSVNYDGAALAMNYRNLGFGAYIYGNHPANGLQANTYIYFSTNIAMSYPHEVHWGFDAREDHGCKLVLIDPTYSYMAEKVDIHLPIKPCTDGALLLGMMNEVVKNDWVDKEFMLSDTVAPYLVRKDNGKFLRASDFGVEPIPTDYGPYDAPMVWDTYSNAPVMYGWTPAPALEGTFTVPDMGLEVSTAYTLLLPNIAEWPIEKAAEFCELPLDKVLEVTRLIAKEGPVTVHPGLGVDHYNGGHRVYHALNTLLALTGNIGRPGAGLVGCNNMGNNYYMKLPFAPYETNFTPGPVIGTVKMANVYKNKRLGQIPINLRGLFFYGHNPLPNMTGRAENLEMFNGVDFIVTADIEMTETARYSDLVLPTCHTFEVEVIQTMATTPFLAVQDKVCEPQFESKNDFDIATLIGKAMGCPLPFDLETYKNEIFDSDYCRAFNLTLEGMRRDKVAFMFPGGHYIQGEGGTWPTPSGKLEFYLEDCSRSVMWEGMDDGDPVEYELEHLPRFEAPHEVWDTELLKKYPLSFTSIRNRFRTHTAFWSCDWLKELQPEPALRMSVKDAADRGIKTGDYVRAYNDRGEIVLKAEVNNGVRPGMVQYPKGWQEFEHIKGAPSDLASHYTHPAAYNNYNFDVLCEVEKYEV